MSSFIENAELACNDGTVKSLFIAVVFFVVVNSNIYFVKGVFPFYYENFCNNTYTMGNFPWILSVAFVYGEYLMSCISFSLPNLKKVNLMVAQDTGPSTGDSRLQIMGVPKMQTFATYILQTSTADFRLLKTCSFYRNYY